MLVKAPQVETSEFALPPRSQQPCRHAASIRSTARCVHYCRPMINKPPPFKCHNITIPIITPIKGMGFINQGSGLVAVPFMCSCGLFSELLAPVGYSLYYSTLYSAVPKREPNFGNYPCGTLCYYPPTPPKHPKAGSQRARPSNACSEHTTE